MLAVKNLGVRSLGRTLLSHINITLSAGEVVAVIGPNGAGKSTLLKAMTGHYALNSGSVQLDGCPIDAYHRKSLARVLAVLPQSSLLNFAFTVREVIALGRIHCADSRAQQQQVIDALLHLMDASHLGHRRYTELSGGEQQRVHLIRVLAQIWDKPASSTGHRYLLLDEPTSALDLTHQKITLDTLKMLAKKEGIGVFMVVHDVNLAARYADKVIVLKDGMLASQGSPWEVLQESMMQSVFQVGMRVIPHPTLDVPLLVAL